jgi:hypothetical protein
VHPLEARALTAAEIGAIGEARFDLLALERGWDVYAPLGRPHAVDRVILRDKDEGLARVQIKSRCSTRRNAQWPRRFTVELRAPSGRSGPRCYAPDAFDLLSIIWWAKGNVERQRAWLMPWELAPSSRLVITEKHEQWRVK